MYLNLTMTMFSTKFHTFQNLKSSFINTCISVHIGLFWVIKNFNMYDTEIIVNNRNISDCLVQNLFVWELQCYYELVD